MYLFWESIIALMEWCGHIFVVILLCRIPEEVHLPKASSDIFGV